LGKAPAIVDPRSSPAAAPVSTLIAEASAAQRAGRADVAKRHLEAALAREPANPHALNMLGLMLLGERQAEAGRDLLLRATEADPAAAPLWQNLATAERALGNDEGERAALAAVLDRDPYALTAHVRKAELHERLGEEHAATAAWQAVLTLCAAQQQPSPVIRDLAARAQAYVAERSARLHAYLTEGLAEARTGLDALATRRFDACLDHAMGKRRIYNSQGSGLHFPFLPMDEYFPRHHFPWMETLEAATPAIQREFAALLESDGAGFRPYVDLPSGAAENIWSELSRSTRWSAYYLWRYGVRNEAACALCPETAALLDALPLADHSGRAPTVFFSLLEPHTRIPPHTGVSNTRAIIHLPLVVPPGCGFRVGGETREWQVGQAWAFDDTIEHEAWNNSDQMRAILIFDVWNPHLTAEERGLLRTFYATADSSGLNPEPAPGF
jgi:tetratricopeptide (TPR) repeat protein